MGRLCQGIGKVPNGSGQRIEGTDTLFVINYENIPCHRRKEITYTSVVSTIRTQKENLNQTRITISENCNCYQGDVGTPTTSLELFKIIVNGILSPRGDHYATFDIKKFYLGNPLDQSGYVKIRLSNIPQEFIDKYDLETCTRDGWVYL